MEEDETIREHIIKITTHPVDTERMGLRPRVWLLSGWVSLSQSHMVLRDAFSTITDRRLRSPPWLMERDPILK